MNKIHVLFVDDEAVSREVTRRILESIGVGRISSASDGFGALTVLREADQQVDVILLDLSMPRLNGYEFIKELRDELSPPHSKTPVIVISGHSEKKALDRMRDLGVGLFLLKPISLDQVVTRINAAVRQKFE